MGGVRSWCFRKRNRVGGQANFQKLRSEHERSTGDNEESKGIKREECFSVASLLLGAVLLASLIGNK